MAFKELPTGFKDQSYCVPDISEIVHYWEEMRYNPDDLRMYLTYAGAHNWGGPKGQEYSIIEKSRSAAWHPDLCQYFGRALRFWENQYKARSGILNEEDARQTAADTNTLLSLLSRQRKDETLRRTMLAGVADLGRIYNPDDPRRDYVVEHGMRNISGRAGLMFLMGGTKYQLQLAGVTEVFEHGAHFRISSKRHNHLVHLKMFHNPKIEGDADEVWRKLFALSTELSGACEHIDVVQQHFKNGAQSMRIAGQDKSTLARLDRYVENLNQTNGMQNHFLGISMPNIFDTYGELLPEHSKHADELYRILQELPL